MKKIILFLIVVSSATADAQSLKELLYSGKLKSDTGSVVRKSDDLASKIDTSKKKPVETKRTTTVRDSTSTGLVSSTDSLAAAGNPNDNSTSKDNNAPKDNNRIWKEFTDSLTSTLKTEVLPSKKIKAGTYYMLVEYEIGTDGQIAINNVSCSPENSFLVQQVKERFTLTAPQMIPVLSNGKARKLAKKYSFNLTKL